MLLDVDSGGVGYVIMDGLVTTTVSTVNNGGVDGVNSRKRV